MELPNLADIPLAALFTYLLAIAAIDVAWNVLLSFVHGDFKLIYVADFIRTHVILRVFAIGALGAVGHGLPAFGIPEIPAAQLAATAALAAYALETIASLREALTDTKPVPEPPTPTPSG